MAMQGPRLAACGRGLFITSAAALLILAGASFREFGATRLAAAADDFQNVFLPPDRSTLRKLSQARALIEEGRHGEAVRFLGDILEEPEDYFFRPDENSPVFRSLKAEAERLIGRMPPKGRELYELQYGAQAQKMLTDALESGEAARLAEVSRRFFHTRGGYQATFLLGLHHFDYGRPLAGALVLQRLHEAGPAVDELEPGLSLTLASCWLQSGMPDKAREALAALRRRDPALRVSVAGKDVPLFENDSEAVGWLTGLIGSRSATEPPVPADWLMFRGNASRTASSDGGPPLLSLRWRVPSADDPLTEGMLIQYRSMLSEQGLPSIPILNPLTVGDVVLMRSLRNLVAVDFTTGKRLWEVPVEDPPDPSFPRNVIQQQQAALALGSGLRMWNDLTFGTLSSDGRLVFSVEDLGMEYGDNAQAIRQIIVFGRMGRQNVRTVDSLCNRLAAHDIRSGKLVWELGGPDGPLALRQAETFFLGPPLPLMGRLYVLAETAKGEVRLLALNPADGELLWSQQISLVEQSILNAAGRRWMGVSPSYADGVLVCPTSTGAVVGIELATRSLLWGYCYQQDNNAFGGNNRVVLAAPGIDRWIDDGVAIRDGRALISPQDSNWLYCLNLIDGELIWKEPRNNYLYVAGVDDEKTVLVGSDAVRAVRLADGKPAWDGRAISLPEGSTPSGRGFLAGNRYFLPLSTAEVAAVDLDAGQIAQVAKSHNGTVPGNLICHKGMIVSQGMQGLDVFFQLDLASAEVRRRLKADPDNPWALSLQGEILLNSDRRSEAVASFRRAYGLAPDPRTRELLRDSLLEGLRSEFAAYRDRGGEIEPLLDDPSQRATYLRLMASGLRGEDRWADAFECYLKLIDLEPGRQPLDQVADGLALRRDRWIRGQLAGLRQEAKDEAAAKIDEHVSSRLKSALAAGAIASLRAFLDNYGGLSAAAPARDELARRLKSEGRRLEAELLTPAAARTAGAVRPAVVWPSGKVEVAAAPTKSQINFGNRYFPIALQEGAGPYFRALTLKFNYNNREVAAFDRSGKEKWKVPLVKEGERQNLNFNVYAMQARAVGRLLLVSLGWNIFAIDTLGVEADDAPRLLWTQDLSNPSFVAADLPGLRQLPLPLAALPPQLQQQLMNRQNQSNLLGPVNANYVCLQRFRNIAGVDPLTGETIWVRQDLSNATDIFGDERHVFVLTNNREEATLLRADDGALLGTRKIPRLSSQQRLPNGQLKKFYIPLNNTCLGIFGRKLLLWWPEGNQRELTLIDPLEGRDEWPRRKFSHNARTALLDDEAVGVMEPAGQFTVVSLIDGHTLVDVKLDAEPNLINIALFKSDGQLLLLTNSNLKSGDMPPIQPMPNQHHRSYSPIYRGRLYAFDPQGKPMWPQPVKVEKHLLLNDQAADLPVVIFGCQHFLQNPNGQGKWKARVLCVDKQSGRKVYEREFDGNMSVFDVACDVEKKTVSLTMQKETVTLTYTDKPVPPPSAADAGPANFPPENTIARALWTSAKKTIVPNADPFGDK